MSLLLISLVFNSCSFTDAQKEAVSSKPADELEFAVDTVEPPPKELKVEEEKIVENPIVESEIEKSAEIVSQVPHPEEAKEQPMIVPEEPKMEDFQKVTTIIQENYKIQKGDTLMMVAFKIYGDYRKWKDLKEWNKEKTTGKMAEGTLLKYNVPETGFGWQPNGMPYMVKTGDTLGMISMDKYGTSKKWKSIYENNRPLIRDPNLIFAGFTIYYVPTRDVASEQR